MLTCFDDWEKGVWFKVKLDVVLVFVCLFGLLCWKMENAMMLLSSHMKGLHMVGGRFCLLLLVSVE